MISSISEFYSLWENGTTRLREEYASHVYYELLLEYPNSHLILANNLHVPSDVLKVLLYSTSAELRKIVAHNKNNSYETSLRLSSDFNIQVRASVATQSGLASDILKKLSIDEEEQVRANVAYQKNVHRDIFEAMFDDESWLVRQSLASRRDIIAEDMERLAADKDEKVVIALASNRRLPIAFLKQLAQMHSNEEVSHQVRLNLQQR